RRAAPFSRAYICSRAPRICSSSFSARIGLSLPELAPIENHWQASLEIRMASGGRRFELPMPVTNAANWLRRSRPAPEQLGLALSSHIRVGSTDLAALKLFTG